MIKRIHVNQHVIRANAKNNETKPCITVKTSKSNRYCHEARVVCGETRIVYSPDKPLSCGAKVWIETESAVQCDIKFANGDVLTETII
jgi:hypothetical protein